MKLGDLRAKRVALVGYGIDVRAAVPHIEAMSPASVCVLLDAPGERVDTPWPVALLADAAGDVDVFVRSPGVPRRHPVLAAAEGRGAQVTTPVALWLHDAAAQGRTVVVVTGTKGKSTTTILASRLAGRAGQALPYAGNVGVPVYEREWDPGTGPAAIEVSSYQAADVESVPAIGVLTALAPDHVDWHGGVDAYVADKLRAFTGGGDHGPELLFVPADDAFAVDATSRLSPRLVALDPTWPERAPHVPTHVLRNAALAVEVVAAVTGSRPGLDDVLDVLDEGLGLPSRLETVAEVSGLRWIDDALASNPTATAAGLRWLRGHAVTLLVGGQARDVPLDPLAGELAEWRPQDLRVVTLPDTGPDMARQLGVRPAGHAPDMAEAVRLATAVTPDGGVVLFSPAAPTPRPEGTWRDRSEAFRRAVAGLRPGETTHRG